MRTEIIAITDKSGSMGSIRDDAIGGFNTFLTDQQKVPGEARLTHVLFDSTVHPPLQQAANLENAVFLEHTNFVPGGGTALLDAIGLTISRERSRIKEEGWAELVVVAILTDGEENGSRLYNNEKIKTLISEAEADGWKFIYLGANQDAFSVAAGLGITKGVAASFAASAEGVHEGYAAMSLNTTLYRTVSAPSLIVDPKDEKDTTL